MRSADQHSDWYDTFLTVSTVIFSVEYSLRLWSCVEDDRFTHPIIGRSVQCPTEPLVAYVGLRSD